MKYLLYHVRVWVSRISAALSSHKSLHTARFALLHELARIAVPQADMAKKLPAIFLASGKHDQVFCVRPTAMQQELGNVALIGKTRIGKGLNIETNLLTWPYATIVNDIKGGELLYRTGGFRQHLGKVFVFDPRGRGARFDPLEGKTTDSDLRSAATTLLYRPAEKENV